MLNNIKKRVSEKTKKTRLGRGYGSMHGGHTATRGMKGQKSRSGGKIPLYFEGGQLPLTKRLPHLKGFKAVNRTPHTIIKLSEINAIKGKDISEEYLIKNEVLVLRSSKSRIKVLHDEDLKEAKNFKGLIFSKKAKESAEKVGSKFI